MKPLSGSRVTISHGETHLSIDKKGVKVKNMGTLQQ
jgi:hypothetical protein